MRKSTYDYVNMYIILSINKHIANVHFYMYQTQKNVIIKKPLLS